MANKLAALFAFTAPTDSIHLKILYRITSISKLTNIKNVLFSLHFRASFIRYVFICYLNNLLW